MLWLTERLTAKHCREAFGISLLTWDTAVSADLRVSQAFGHP